MGKRSNFERIPRDYYPTPYEAVVPLAGHLPSVPFTYCEPCAGDGRLVRHLSKFGGTCTRACDVEPRGIDGSAPLPIIEQQSALPDLMGGGLANKPVNYDFIITNPPWQRDILHKMIEHFRHFSCAWLLFDGAWAFTKQAAPYLKYCAKIVVVGRVKWIEGSEGAGKDDCAWYLFSQFPTTRGAPAFFGAST